MKILDLIKLNEPNKNSLQDRLWHRKIKDRIHWNYRKIEGRISSGKAKNVTHWKRFETSTTNTGERRINSMSEGLKQSYTC